jgi:hypothetical protein
MLLYNASTSEASERLVSSCNPQVAAVTSLLRLILVGAQCHLSFLIVAAALALVAADEPALAAGAAVAAVA